MMKVGGMEKILVEEVFCFVILVYRLWFVQKAVRIIFEVLDG